MAQGRPLLQDSRALPDGQSYARAMLDGAGKQFLGLGEMIAGVQQAVDLLPSFVHFSSL